MIGMLVCLTSNVHAEGSVAPVKISMLKQKLYESFQGTSMETRIVKVTINKRRGKKIQLSITWHPYKVHNILEDMVTILKVAHEVIPNFSVARLRAVHPDYVRWSKYIIWEATITKKQFMRLLEQRLDKSASREPVPLF